MSPQPTPVSRRRSAAGSPAADGARPAGSAGLVIAAALARHGAGRDRHLRQPSH
ncbi:hypothetical protein ACFC0M_01255 [Streptomyces sp. NPDC056149]|uniref:hypothetical protein n=1 Tax=Streptomyces sp. NPDC056149 TaxID=3345728 RepID=UPI0035D96867